MDFYRVTQELTILRPVDFSQETQIVEYREDPLTGVPCRINKKRSKRPKQTPKSDAVLDLLRKSPDCPFCPENINDATPRFTSDICTEGYYQVGACRLFPNLFPLAQYHANITLAEEHFVPLDRFQKRTLVDAITVARAFLHDLNMPNSLYPILCWNHLPPSASSIVHPHMQLLIDSRPTPYQLRLLESSKEYYMEKGTVYWEDLVQEEKARDERFIGENASLWILASYSPQANREFHIIFKEIASLSDLDEKRAGDFADVVLSLLRYYSQSGVDSFNLTTLSAALDDGNDSVLRSREDTAPFYRLSAKLIARPAVQQFYRNDTGILERVHYEADIEMEPELLAGAAKVFLRA